MPKVVLITGCSTGIGRDLAWRLVQAGYRVAATARKAETLEGLPAALKIALDVTQSDSVNCAVAETIEKWGRIDVLVNNAGYSQPGAVEELTEAQVQRMFDVNVFGALRLIRAVAPHMRAQRSGQIVNISSIAGKLSTPVNGTYSATKFALEALSDALRLELAPFGIQVIVIEPGSVKTHFGATAQGYGQATLANPGSPYQPLYKLSDEFEVSMQNQAAEPGVVSEVIRQAIEAPKPKARYHANIPFSGKMMLALGGSVWDLALRRLFKVNASNLN